MKDILLFIGTVDGAAESAGLQLVETLESKGYSVDVNLNPKLNDLLSMEARLLLVITSTTGEGELPHDLRPLWRKLFTKRPSLNGIHYAVTVLGDSSYGDNFCLAGKELDELLEERGAKKIKPVFLNDAEESVFPEDDISNWGVEVLEKFFELEASEVTDSGL